MKINDQAPNFSAQSTNGDIDFHEWCADLGHYFFHIQRILHLYVRLK